MNDASDDECNQDTKHKGVLRHRPDFVPDIFPANKPPEKKQRVLVRGRKHADASSYSVQSNGGRGSSSASAASAHTAEVDEVTSSARAKSKRVERSSYEKPAELLDSRDVPDADELYTENERALSQFIRLHPMLSLESTSERTLSTAASLVDSYALPTRELEVVSKTHDDLFLRRANLDAGERPCINGDKCVCRWLAIFRYGEETDAAFVCREFLLPSQLKEFQNSGRVPKTQGKCLMCARYFTAYTYTLARNSPDFCPKSCISIQAFGNLIESTSPEDDVLGHSNSIGGDDGYNADAMLYVDEKWTDTAASRGPLGTLLWRPVVRFKTSDYVFLKNASDGLYTVIQTNIGANRSDLDFGQPPSSMTKRVEA